MFAVQNGNHCSTENRPVVALVSVELGLFTGVIERYQPWIEGIFASIFMWALHSLAAHTACSISVCALRSQPSAAICRDARVGAAGCHAGYRVWGRRPPCCSFQEV